MREVVVTGATGFVGSHLVEELRGRGVSVRAVVRATSDTRHLRDLGVMAVTASLEDGDALRAAIRDADVVIHLAALTHAQTEAALARVNEGGTASLLDAALSSEKLPRFVYLSSLAALGPSSGRRLGRDDVPAPLTAYGRTKLAGEVAVRAVSDRMRTVTIRAPAVYGPGDRELLRFFRLAKLGVLPIPGGPDRPLQLVHVKDLARGIADAALQDVTGTFNIAETRSYEWREVCRLIGRAVGKKPIFVPVPRAAISGAAVISEMFSRLSGTSTMFNRDKVRELLAPGWLCETATARRAFGFEARISLDEGMQGTAEWYRIKGWL